MTLVDGHRRLLAAALAGAALLAAACGPAPESVAPTSIPTASPSPSPSVTPSPAPTPTPTPSPTASPSAATACVVTPQTGLLPSDRFTDLQVSTGTTADRLTFVFGNSSLPGPTAGLAPKGSLEVARPPYTQAGSGATIVVTGGHVVQIKFTGMSLQNDAGEQTYGGPAELTPAFPALRHAVLYDASEGVVGWYVGFDGSGCVTLARTGTNVTITIDHS